MVINMIGKKNPKIDTENLNEVISLSKRILRIFYLLSIFSIIGLGIYLLRETKVFVIIGNILRVISPLFIGLIVAWLLDPIVNWFVKKGVKRVIASIFAFFILILILYLLIILIFPALVNQINDFIGVLPTIVNEVIEFIGNFFDKLGGSGVDLSSVSQKMLESIQSMGTDIATSLPTSVVNIATSFVSGLGMFLLGLVVGFYLLVDFDGIKNVLDFIPKRFHKNIKDLASRLNTACRNFLQGTLLVALAVFILSLIGFSVIGLKAPMLFALICAITNIIPYIGPWIGGGIAAIVGFTISPLVGILTIVMAFVIQQVDAIILQPLIMGKTMKLHPVTIMIGLLLFGYFFGVLGMIFATPIIAGIKIVINFFDEKYDFMSKIKNINQEEKVVKDE